MREFTVLALVRPWEIPWGDTEGIRSSLHVDWVRASSADHARTAFLLAYARRTGSDIEDAVIVAVLTGRLVDGDPLPSSVAITRQQPPPQPLDKPGEHRSTHPPQTSGDVPALLTVKQFVSRHTCFSNSWLRGELFNRGTNGLDAAVTQCGKKILIDEAKFFEWLKTKRGPSTPLHPLKKRT